MKDFINVAVAAAREAGALLIDNFRKPVELEHKADKSIVTVLDKQCERMIIDKLHSSFPVHQFIGEESTLNYHDLSLDEYTWVIDPLDGTHNYVRGIALFGVSIGLIRGDEFLAGVIYLPCENVLYTSEKGCGAFKNDKRIQVSSTSKIEDCTLSYDSGFKSSSETKISMLSKIAPNVFNARIFGASVRNLTYLAEGSVDSIIEFDDKIWDFAAGISLVIEAGGMVTNHKGEKFIPEYHNYLATNGKIHAAMLQLMNR